MSLLRRRAWYAGASMQRRSLDAAEASGSAINCSVREIKLSVVTPRKPSREQYNVSANSSLRGEGGLLQFNWASPSFFTLRAVMMIIVDTGQGEQILARIAQHNIFVECKDRQRVRRLVLDIDQTNRSIPN